MSLHLQLNLKQTQSLVLTPQLQQAIRLLQLSTVELQGEIAREVAENPFLNLVEPLHDLPRGEAAPPAAATGAGGDDDSGWAQPSGPAAADCRLGLKRTIDGGHDDLPSLEARLSRPEGLGDSLRAQICQSGAPRPVAALAEALIDWLDQDGYLREADAELAQALDVEAAAVGGARALLQRLEPTGIAARDLAECLGLQLRERDRLDPAMAAFLRHLDKVARAEWAQLERVCRVDREDLEGMVQELRALDPRPGRCFPDPSAGEVVPDVVVAAIKAGVWRIELNARTMPKLAVDGDYYAEVAPRLTDGHKTFVAERFQNANWLTRALQQRSSTILQVSKAIFARQQGFLERGARGLKPLVLRDIATATGLHESTVSRATSAKYVQTPHGTYPLKYFFTTAIQATATTGGDHSAEAIRQRIRRLIAEEGKAVLSDDQIVDLLKADGALIARRTVAKYREGMNIPSSVARRRAKSLPR